ncbi:MAG: signal recognition particle protein [Rhodocyclaceae bacterium]|nr:signal recognition particle protein [Rhodocyclaceae bacterium]
MLDQLTQKFAKIVKNLTGQARLTEENIQEMLREVRIALLEADVALPVVKAFISEVKQKAIGEEVIGSLTPGQALVGVVYRELAALMGGAHEGLNLSVQPPAVILLAGLQGAGKTTTAAKLGKWIKERLKKKVLTVSCDVYRPAAIEQLKTVSQQAGLDCYPTQPQDQPVAIALAALDYARRHYYDVLIVDTAGRLAVDEEMMQEARALAAALKPVETLFVVDAMLGQDAVNTAKAFADALPLTGVILTKLDGDARGGAALSVRFVTGKPIKFTGVGEKLDGLAPFHPERMAGRILGMGDILGLVEEAKARIEREKAEALVKKMKAGKGFDLADFREQILEMRKMGGLSALLDKMPAHLQKLTQQAGGATEERAMRRIVGIIDAMTPEERARPEIIKASRKRRIAAGAGVTVQEVNRLLNQFEQTQKMMKQFAKGGMAKMLRAAKGLMGRGMPGLPR